MKTALPFSIAAIIAIFVLSSISWNKKNNTEDQLVQKSIYDVAFSTNYKFPQLSDFNEAIDEDDWFFNGSKPNKTPPADDVMVQRIPGDNYHLLIMAVYTYATFHEQVIKINNGGEEVVLRDDGLQDDKVAGDGIYTAKIFTDVKEFRKLAADMLKATIKNNWEPLFTDREFNYSTVCDNNPFSEERFDKNEAVSITNLDVVSSLAPSALLNQIRQNCVFLTPLSIVEDSTRTWNSCTQQGNIDGPWTFKTLMKNLATQDPSNPASDQTISDFVKGWLDLWTVQQVINGDTVAARTSVNQKILNPWLAKSLAAGNPAGFLDMHFAPFKLTAIVNRFDLRNSTKGIPVGEGRFVFCLISSDCTGSKLFTVIFEYGINKADNCDSVRSWARQWFNLKNLTLGSPEYLTALQAITDQFTLCGTNPNRTHQSSLDALRTNEVVLANAANQHWELREFGIDSSTHTIQQRLLPQVPADRYNVQIDNADVRNMVQFINDNSTGIAADNYTVPVTFNSVPFLAGKSTVLDTPVGTPTRPYHWDGVNDNQSPAFITSTTGRHIFSRNTCSGCHSGEVQTFFTHVDPVFFGTQATLSGFLSGTAGTSGGIDADGRPDNDRFKVRDAANRGTVSADKFHTFNDIKRRAQDLKQVATATCGGVFSLRNELMFHPVGAVD